MKQIMVCIDPGHGGKDPGAVGPSGLRESDVVLSVGLTLRDLLEDLGVTVIMTRDSDKYLTLSKRVDIANKARVDVFISIHCNSAENPAWGIETWIARETAVSYPLAEAVQDAMCAEFPKSPDRGVKRANFTVIKNTAMAACLAELDFIHTPCGEELLADKSNQAKYAAALCAGLAKFLNIETTAAPPAEKLDPEEPVACDAVSLVSALRPLMERMSETLNKFDH